MHRKSPRHSDALSLPAAKSMRIARHILGTQSNDLQQIGHPVLQFVTPRDLVNQERLTDNLQQRHTGIQR